jgi:UDP-GlcNAc:undecaprenyl-phosphate GlcNAc-1-phosphate transferase
MSFLIALVAAVLLTPVAGWVGRAAGFVDRPGDELKIHPRAVPTLGGVAVLGAVAVSIAVAERWPGWGVAAAAGLALVIGMADDRWSLPPWARAILVASSGFVLVWGSALPGRTVIVGLGVVLLVLACANAVNIMDGQDGLAGGLVAIAALGLAAAGWVEGETAPAIMLPLGGALVGFLAWNRPPARVFLGNGGAYAVGLLLAFGAARLVLDVGWPGLLSAGACLGVFAFELVFTVVRRRVSGGSVAAGDRLHSYDLVALRTGRSGSTLVFLGFGLAAATLGVFLVAVPLWAGVVTAAAASGAAALWGAALWAKRPAATT